MPDLNPVDFKVDPNDPPRLFTKAEIEKLIDERVRSALGTAGRHIPITPTDRFQVRG